MYVIKRLPPVVAHTRVRAIAAAFIQFASTPGENFECRGKYRESLSMAEMYFNICSWFPPRLAS
jgi:hypothetical protein